MDETGLYQEILLLENKPIITNFEEFYCIICYTNIQPDNGIILQNCLHTFCRKCVIKTIENCEGVEVLCPFKNEMYECNFTLQQREIRNLISVNAFEKYLLKSLAVVKPTIKNTFDCQTINCQVWCILDDDMATARCATFNCPGCNSTNCIPCKAIHPLMNCQQYVEFHMENDPNVRKNLDYIQQLKISRAAMNCPHCNILIIKLDGCEDMDCSMCKRPFKWIL